MNIKIGVVGTNFISDWLVESLDLVEGIQATTVYSRKQETGDTFAKRHGIPQVYTNYQEFLSSNIDVVYIASPTSAHAPQAMEAMNRGKHVLCEKIIAANSEELEEMITCAVNNNVILLEAMRPDFDPYMEIVIEQLPKIGQVRRVTFEMDQYSSRYDAFKEGVVMNAFDPSLGNAALMDIGVYPIHCLVRIFGAPREVKAMSTFLHNGFEGAGIVLLKYDHMIAEAVYSKISKSVNPSIIEGEDATIKIYGLTIMDKIEVCYRDGRVEEIELDRMENNMHLEVEGLRDLIEAKDVRHRYLEYSRQTMKIVDEVRKQTRIVFK